MCKIVVLTNHLPFSTNLQVANYGKMEITQIVELYSQNCSVLQFMLPPQGGMFLHHKYESAEAFRVGDILFQTTLASPIDDCISY